VSAAYKNPPSEIMSMWPDGSIRPHKVARVVKTGRKSLLKVVTRSGRVIKATPEHRLLTTEGFKSVDEMRVGMELITVPRKVTESQRQARRESIMRLNRTAQQRTRTSQRLSQRIAAMSQEELAAYTQRARTGRSLDTMRVLAAAMTERTKWLWAHDPD